MFTKYSRVICPKTLRHPFCIILQFWCCECLYSVVYHKLYNSFVAESVGCRRFLEIHCIFFWSLEHEHSKAKSEITDSSTTKEPSINMLPLFSWTAQTPSSWATSLRTKDHSHKVVELATLLVCLYTFAVELNTHILD